MKRKIIIGVILMLTTISIFAGCVENKSYDDEFFNSVIMEGSLADVGFQLYDGKTILYVKFTTDDVPYYIYAPEHDLSGFYWFLNHGIGSEVALMYTDVDLDYNYLYDVWVNGTWFYG